MRTRMDGLRRVVVVLGLALLLQAMPSVPSNEQVAVGATAGVLGGCSDGTCGNVVK